MPRADKMRSKRGATSVYLAKLIKAYGTDNEAILCVFEGEDAKYYGGRIDSVSVRVRKNIQCKGKENVKKLKERVSANYELVNANVLYFIDKDFECDETTGDLYVTPCYSVENLYVSELTLSRVLADEFGLDDSEHNFDLECITSSFRKANSEFNESMLCFNSWLKLQVEESKTNKDICLNIDNISLNKLVSIEINGVSANYTLENLGCKFPGSGEVNQASLDKAIEEFNKTDLSLTIRGKHRLEFFRIWLNLLMQDARCEAPTIFTRKTKTKLCLSKDNLLSELSQYAITPNCLNEFLLNANFQENSAA